MNTAAMNNPYKVIVKKARAHRAKTAKNEQVQLCEGGFTDSAALNRDLFYFTGRWLGSGLLRPARETGDQDRYDLFVTIWIGAEEQHMRLIHATANIADKLADYLRFRPAPHGKEILIHAPVLDEWLDMHFVYDGKCLPDWVYDLPEAYRRALLDGLIDESPLCYKPTCRFYVTNKHQAFEVKRLAESLGYAPSVHAGLPVDSACVEPCYSGVKPIYTIDLHAPFCHTDNASA